MQKIAGMDLASLLNSPGGAVNSNLTSLFEQWDNDEKIPGDIPLSEFIYEKSFQAGGNGKKLRCTRNNRGNGRVLPRRQNSSTEP